MSWCTHKGMIRQASEGELKNRKYCLKELLNMGNFAYSYLAEDRSGQRFFVKEYVDPKNTKVQKEAFKAFKKHLEVMQERLNKIPDAVAQIKEIFVEGPMIYTVHEFMEGKDLLEILKIGKITIDQRKLFALVFLSSLSRVHGEGIVHADLKPEQIYLEEDPSIELKWRIYICDFDFSLIYDGDRLISKPPAIVGTPGYFSPEHIKGEVPTFKSDVFTAGIILYQILFGFHPFAVKGSYYEDLALKGKPAFIPHEKYNWVPQVVSDLMVKMFSPRKEDRPDIKELLEAFRNWIRGGVSSPQPDLGKDYKVILLKHSSGKVKRIWREGIIERHSLRILGNVEDLSNQVFEIKKVGKKWLIRGLPPENGKSPVVYNGIEITNKWVPLSIGGELKLGSLKLIVSFK